MAKFPCPVCGDPNGFPLWIDPAPPIGCPHDDAWFAPGIGPPEILAVTDCPYQMGKARQRAAWMKATPEAFDSEGNMKPGGLAKCLVNHPPGQPVIV